MQSRASFRIVVTSVVLLLAGAAAVATLSWRRESATALSTSIANAISDENWGAGNFDLLGPAIAFRDNEREDKCGYLNRRGDVVIEPKYDWASDFEDKLALVAIGARFRFIDEKGNDTCVLPEGADKAFRSEGLVWFHHRDANRWGLMSDNGHSILEPTFDQVEPFAEDLAAVNLGTEWLPSQVGLLPMGGRWGYIDKRGEQVIPIQFKFANSFSEGLAAAWDDVGWKYIDRAGKTVVRISEGSPGAFRNGLAPVITYETDSNARGSTRFINKVGETQFRVIGSANEIQGGLARVRVKDGGSYFYGFLNDRGEMVVPALFVDAQDFSEGLAAVRHYDSRGVGHPLWGYIDKNGNNRIAPEFNEVTPFRGGVARVHIGGQMPVVYDGPMLWKGGEWWLIDRKGQKLRRL